MHRLIREDDRAVYGDKGYASAARKRAAERPGVKWGVKEKALSGRKLTARQGTRNRSLAACAQSSSTSSNASSATARCAIALLALTSLYLARSRLASA